MPDETTQENLAASEPALSGAEGVKRPRGGRRPGAGAPRGNLNGLKHGRYSTQLAQVGLAFAASPKVQVTLLEIARRHEVKQKKAEVIAAMMLANILKRGIEIKTAEQRRAVVDFKDSLDRI